MHFQCTASGLDDDDMNKIFGIGISKTGTTSLAAALVQLGYRGVSHPNPGLLQQFSQGQFDFGTDMPFSIHYRQYDREFPGSRFILTIRPNLHNWLQSVQHQHQKMPLQQMPAWATQYRQEKYNMLDFDTSNQIVTSMQHHIDVLSYFRNRPEDLLVLNIFDGDGWEPLCRFLGNSVPDAPFPCLNRRGIQA